MLKRLAAVALTVVSLSAQAGSLEKEIEQVERIRGAKFLRPVRTSTIARDDLQRRLQAQLVKTMPYSLDEYLDRLGALHLIDLDRERAKGKLFSLLDQQVLAFYDPLEHIYYEIAETPASAVGMISPSLVAVHELTHALQDQRFGIGKVDTALSKDWDAGMAYHAVVEGEATFVMMAAMLDGMMTVDALADNEALLAKVSEASQAAGLVDASVPPYFVESLKFPYFAGLRLVMQAYKHGGWQGVDALYQNLPRSTREVMHPEEYFERVARPGGAPAASPAIAARSIGVRSDTEHLGEFHWAFLVGAENARGWMNDSVVVANNDRCEPTVLATTMWQTEKDAATFEVAYSQFLAERERRARVVRNGKVVRAAYGADPALIEKFLE